MSSKESSACLRQFEINMDYFSRQHHLYVTVRMTLHFVSTVSQSVQQVLVCERDINELQTDLLLLQLCIVILAHVLLVRGLHN
jgi:hypothetical protein